MTHIHSRIQYSLVKFRTVIKLSIVRPKNVLIGCLLTKNRRQQEVHDLI